MDNKIGLTLEQALDIVKVLPFDMKPEYLSILSTEEITGTQMIALEYIEEHVPFAEIITWREKAEAYLASGKASDLNFAHLQMVGADNKDDMNDCIIQLQMIYIQGEDAEYYVSILREHAALHDHDEDNREGYPWLN